MKTTFRFRDIQNLILFTAILCLFSEIQAQVSLAPSALFIDEKSGIANLYISNRSTTTQEIIVSFVFGYPGSDEKGNLVMQYDDPLAAGTFGLDSYIRAFPRSFILEPNQQQTVRIQVRPSATMKDGFYFTRIKVHSSPEVPALAENSNDAINAQISFKFEQVTAVFYKKGKVETGLKVSDLELEQTEKELIVIPVLERLGNAPFIGTFTARLMDSNGIVVSEAQTSTTAYFDTKRRLSLNTENLQAGYYKLELNFMTKRKDMASTDLIQAPDVIYTVHVELPLR
ncbi:MAG: hypothetical protein IPI60_19180 [Saprospiraceae bacterium]|nr:hypothetical protein [Saprospiraceae bacterium]